MLPDQFSGDGGDPAILSAADPHALEGGVPVRGVVGINGRCSAIFTGRPTCLAANAASTASARMNSLPPKPPPI